MTGAFTVAVLDDIDYREFDSAAVTRLCAATFSYLGIDVNRIGEVSVAFVTLNEIHDLNLKYRKKDSPTDVLTFLIDGLEGEMAGEIVIAPEYVYFERGAVEELIVHGALHMAGMDHGEDFEESEMSRIQEAVLRSLHDTEN